MSSFNSSNNNNNNNEYEYKNKNKNNNHSAIDDANSHEKSTHLFVLIHGLWGTPKHMSTIEDFIKESINDEVTKDQIVTLKPSCFGFWKTYDGLELNAKKIIQEMFYEIESLKQKNKLIVKRISFIGYSLGGLFSRYIIGLLNEIGFFELVEPVFFCTFATPHLGIHFFRNNFFDTIANNLGPYMFGKSGGQLFIADHEKILVAMADPQQKYMQGLRKFKKHILMANIKNDRTVAFFTSYITSYSPFDELDKIKVKYLKNLPHSEIATKSVRPKFVDLTRSRKIEPNDAKSFIGNLQEETPVFRRYKIVKFCFLVLICCFVVPFWIPFVLITSSIVSIYSYIKVKVHSIPDIKSHWERASDYLYGGDAIDLDDAKAGQERRERRNRLVKHESFKGDTSQLAENTMEGIMYAEEKFGSGKRSAGADISDEEDEDEKDEEYEIEAKAGDIDEKTFSSDISNRTNENGEFIRNVGNVGNVNGTKLNPKLINLDYQLHDEKMNEHLSTLQEYDRFILFKDEAKLELDEDRAFIERSLNLLNWIKIPVFLDVWNAHDGIVSRRGVKSNPKGAATIGLWASILRNYLREQTEPPEGKS